MLPTPTDTLRPGVPAEKARDIISGVYTLLLIARASDPNIKAQPHLWGLAASSCETGVAFAKGDEIERLLRVAIEKGGLNRFSLTVSGFAVDTLHRICQRPLGEEVGEALKDLRSHRDGSGGYGAVHVSNKDGSTFINSIPRHTAGALRMLVHAEEIGLISDTVTWLLKHQSEAGGWSYGASRKPDFYSTSHVIEALHVALGSNSITDKGLEERIRASIVSAMDWLVASWNTELNRPSGLWVLNAEEAPERYIMDSSDALARLYRASRCGVFAPSHVQFLSERISALISTQNPDGSFGNHSTGEAPQRYSLLGSTIQAVEALLEVKEQGCDEGCVAGAHAAAGLEYILSTITNYDSSKQLWLSDFTALACILSRETNQKLAPKEASALRDLAKLEPPELLRGLPSQISDIFGPTYKFVLRMGERGSTVGWLARRVEAVPSWVLKLIMALPGLSVLVGWLAWLFWG